MSSLKEQFKFQVILSHFGTDNHTEVQNLIIENIRILTAESADKDIIVVSYQGSPNLSFYNTDGKLLDVDHYLPQNYKQFDRINLESIISNLKHNDVGQLKSSENFEALLLETLEAGHNDFVSGIESKFSLSLSQTLFNSLVPQHESGSQMDVIKVNYSNFYDLLSDIVIRLQKSNGYVYITASDNIVITPLNKRCGLSVIIESQDINNHLLPVHRWNIIRTTSSTSLNQSLAFRTTDVKNYFTESTYSDTYETERYKLFYDDKQLSIDSFLDNTDNVLRVTVVNNCYKIMASDHNIIAVLSKPNEITIVNTHKSVVPHKWPKKILFPELFSWVRVDENISMAFCQNERGLVSCYDISIEHPEKIAELGIFAPKFELNQNGHLLALDAESRELIKIKTNLQEIEVHSDQKNFNTVFNNLSHLFKGESLFIKTKFAKPISKAGPEPESKLPSVIEKAKYDFESNVENMLVSTGNTYEELINVQNKMAIARTNITEELMSQADKENVFLVGQRLKSTINNIMAPSELRVRNLVENLRSKNILATAQSFRAKSQALNDANAFREILNKLRIYRQELDNMLSENVEGVLSEFKTIHEELNHSFSGQISQEGNTLQEFIASEIEEIENEIANTHHTKTLEQLLSTHPAALELISLLKQPYILQTIAKEKKLSPAAIQTRLFKAIENRKLAILGEQERAESQKNAAKGQLVKMIKESIDFFVLNHSSSFSDIELSTNPTYQNIQLDINRIEKTYSDVRMSMDLRRILNRKILERSRVNLENRISFEGKYAFIKNDPHLFVDLDTVSQKFPKWHLELTEKKGSVDKYLVSFVKESDKEVYRPSTTDNLRSGKAFELDGSHYAPFFTKYDLYIKEEYSYELLDALWNIYEGQMAEVNYPQFARSTIQVLLPTNEIERKALRCALEKKSRDVIEKTRKRNVPNITPEFIDNTPYFQHKLQEFVIKSKLQLASGSGLLLLTGPPSTGKSAFLKYAASIMNREYFEHASDKWQTKNSLVTAIRFGEFGPYSVPAGFTKAITTPNSLINIEEVKEWPEALRKSLNPFFAGSKVFLSPDGTRYNIADNILLCAATNLGAIYRQDDEPFTADFWSRIEVVEYDYAPHHVSREYYNSILNPRKHKLLTVQDLARQYFLYDQAPDLAENKAVFFSKQFLEFTLLPKADEEIKRANLSNYINEYFDKDITNDDAAVSPEEAAKVTMKRLKDFHDYTPKEFYDLYDHFINGQTLKTRRLSTMKARDNDMYNHLKILILNIAHIEACLRSLRDVFYSSAGQTEIEGTNREFIKCVYLLGMMGKF